MGDFWRHWVPERYNKQPLSTLLKTALVRLPRAAPISALQITNPEGPQPFILQLPSRQQDRTIPLYVFVPPVQFPEPNSEDHKPTPNTFPVVTDYHGGGFYLGSCLEQAPFCAKLCRELSAIVISVDYRMAPFDMFPAAIEDADDVVSALLDPNCPGYQELRQGIADYLRTQWHKTIATEKERKHGSVPMPPQPEVFLDTTRIAFSGASSGGNIALNVAQSVPASLGLPDWPSRIPPDYPTQIPLLLLYPSLDLRQLPSERLRHDRMPPLPKPKDRGLNIDDHLAATYVTREMAGHPKASPGLVDTRVGLHKNAKILLILSGLDTLWEQSEIWCKKIEDEGRGRDVKIMRYPERKHGWTTIPEIALNAEERNTRLEVLDECVRFTGAAWQGSDPIVVMEKEFGNIVSASPSAPSHPDPGSIQSTESVPQDEALAELINMGFPAFNAQVALKESGGDMQGAIEHLLQHEHGEGDQKLERV